jgi:hypothetical protein
MTMPAGNTKIATLGGKTVRAELFDQVKTKTSLIANNKKATGEMVVQALAGVLDGRMDPGTIGGLMQAYADAMTDTAWKRFKADVLKAVNRHIGY